MACIDPDISLLEKPICTVRLSQRSWAREQQVLKPEVLGRKTNQSKHLGRYVSEVDYGAKSGPPADIIIAGATTLSETRLAINYILGGPSENQYQSKRQ